jgi:putative ABC transport system permease protein
MGAWLIGHVKSTMPRRDRTSPGTLVLRYVWRDLLHNPRRTLASLVGVTLGVGLFSGVLFFMDGSGATMTRRAIAPLALDIQRVLTSPPSGGLRLTEQISALAPLSPGQGGTITLTLTNEGVATANEVVVNDVPPPQLTYVNGTTNMNGEPIPDIDGESPLSHGVAGFGLNIGTVEPGGTVQISYAVKDVQAVEDVGMLPLRGAVSSREQPEPTPANTPPVLTLEELQRKVAMIPGVASADGLGFVDLPSGSLAMGTSRIRRPVRVFAFDLRYQARYPSIRIVAGGFRPASALLSAEAARALAAEPGATLDLRIPGRRAPLSLPMSGVVDLARAQPLFSSRKSTKFEEFLYVPDSIVVTPETFRDTIIPAFDTARASVGNDLKSFPVLELDVSVDRPRLQADPGGALEQTKRISRAIGRIGPGQDYLIDNISNTLAVARDDATVGKRMFLFLGLPGVLMAAFLAAYAGSILSAAQRREHANLRVRGAHRGHLRRIAIYKALAFAGAGSILGIALGLASAVAILGWTTSFEAAQEDLAISGVIAAGAGAVITTMALYVPARRSVNREIAQERREMRVARIPAWKRLRLDLALLAAAGVAEVAAARSGALDPPSGSVYSGVAITLPSRLLVAPLFAWVGGLLLSARSLFAIASRLPAPPSHRFGPVVGGILSRSLRRRSWALATGTIGLGLVVAFGMSLAIFTATYDAAKAADSRFVVGSDLRITPSVLSDDPHRLGYASKLTVPGVSTVSPVVFRLENSVLIGLSNQRRKNLAAIDPASFARVAPLPDSLFVERSAASSLAALGADQQGVLVDAETADDLSVEKGDTVTIILALGTRRETQERFRVVGLFDRFPGFPEGANLVVNLSRYEEATGLQRIDFFLAAVVDRSDAGLDRAIAALRSGPREDVPVHIDSTETTLDKDQSSLTAVNVNGLVGLDTLYMLLMSAAAIAIFIFGLMLQRRREYVTLRAQGLGMSELHALILAEAALVAVCGATAGLLVGSGIAFLLVHILRALFILDPTLRFPVGRIAMLLVLVLTATIISGLAATEILRRLKPTEILREE